MATTHDEISLREELVSLKRQNTQTAEALRLATGRTRALEEALRKPASSETRGPRALRCAAAPARLRPWPPLSRATPSSPARNVLPPAPPFIIHNRARSTPADVVAQVANDSRVSELAEELERSRRRERSLQDKLRHLDNSHVSDIQARVRIFHARDPAPSLPLSDASASYTPHSLPIPAAAVVVAIPTGKDCRVRKDAETTQTRSRHKRAERETERFFRVAVRQSRARGWRWCGRPGWDSRRPATARPERQRRRRCDDTQRCTRHVISVCVRDACLRCRGCGRIAADGKRGVAACVSECDAEDGGVPAAAAAGFIRPKRCQRPSRRTS